MLTITTALLLAMQAAPATSACRLARIAGTERDARTWVYRFPNPGARREARLRGGEGVFVCGEKGRWLWIRYADARHSCGGIGGGTPPYTSACADGWVDRRRVVAVGR